MTRQTYDWTFTTRFKGDITVTENTTISKTDEQIPIALLTSMDPILFYDDVILFEDELADNGSAIMNIKLRVMPRCFFALQRFFLRVDDVFFRVIEIRLFHQFGQQFLLREYQEKYSTSKELLDKHEVLYEYYKLNLFY